MLKWTDVHEIALALLERFPSDDPITISFPTLYQRVMALDEFADNPEHCSERILEAIQMAWLDEAD